MMTHSSPPPQSRFSWAISLAGAVSHSSTHHYKEMRHISPTPHKLAPLNSLGRFTGHLITLFPWKWKAFLILPSCFSVAQSSLTLVTPWTPFSI